MIYPYYECYSLTNNSIREFPHSPVGRTQSIFTEEGSGSNPGQELRLQKLPGMGEKGKRKKRKEKSSIIYSSPKE